jgi:AraC family ethanolamine operon transcriptional activator
MLALSAPEDRLSAVVRLLCRICDAVESTSPMDARRTAALEVAVLAALASLIEARHAPQQAARERPGRFRAVMRAREFIHENLAERVSLPRLCDASRVSARTLEYGFREFFGVSPLAYVRFERLGQVHRELHGARRTEVSVTEAAMRWGFWHLGQFSRDYRSLFGECPSATLARARARRLFDAGRSAARSRRADRTPTVTGLPAG